MVFIELLVFLFQLEQQVFIEEGVDLVCFVDWLKDYDFGLFVVCDVIVCDVVDCQQLFNLQVLGGCGIVGVSGMVYDIEYLQFYQGDCICGYGGCMNFDVGCCVFV